MDIIPLVNNSSDYRNQNTIAKMSHILGLAVIAAPSVGHAPLCITAKPPA